MNYVEPIKSLEEIRKFEKILKKKSKRNLLLFVFGTNSGLRISDILALDVKDVLGKDYVEITEKKTGKRKKFPLNSKLKELIRKYVRGKKPTDPLFTTKFKNRLERCQAYRILNNAAKKAEFKGKFGTHSLRKTFGYHHYRQFRDVALLQKIFNHSTPNITLRYIGIDQEEIDKSYSSLIL